MLRKVHPPIILLISFCLGNISLNTVSENIYKTISNDGITIYSDKAPLGDEAAEIVTLKNSNRLPIVRSAPRIDSSNKSGYLNPTVEIVTPKNQQVISMGPGDFKVSVSVMPALATVEELELILDGKSLLTQRDIVWNLKNISRGPHQLQVVRKHESGEILHKSPKIEILVLRPIPVRR